MAQLVRDDSYSFDTEQERHVGFCAREHQQEGAPAERLDALTVARAVEDLVAVAERHLVEEEASLRNCQHAELAAHLAQHRFLTHQLRFLKSAFGSGQLMLAKCVVDFLETWLNYHRSRTEPPRGASLFPM